MAELTIPMTKRPVGKHRGLGALAFAYVGLYLGDVVTSLIGFAIGGVEAHPFGFALVLVIKAIVLVAAFLLARWMIVDWFPRFGWLYGMPALLALCVPLVWNVAQLAALS